MADEPINPQGATPADLSDGQTTGGASPAPKDDASLHGDGIVPKVKEPVDPNAGNPPADDSNKNKDEPADPATDDDDDDTPSNDDWKKEYVSIGDEAGESVIALLKEEGVSPVEANAIFEDALKSGNLDDVKWDVLESRLGKDKARLAEIGIRDYYQRVYSAHAKTVEEVMASVGGEDNWKVIKSWVKRTEKADPSQKKVFDEIRADLDKGGRAAKAAVADLKKMYEGDPKNKSLGAGKTLHSGDGGTPAGLTPISRADYFAEMEKASKDGNNKLMAELNARRRLGMQQGI